MVEVAPIMSIPVDMTDMDEGAEAGRMVCRLSGWAHG